jgi:hypothetical protein
MGNGDAGLLSEGSSLDRTELCRLFAEKKIRLNMKDKTVSGCKGGQEGQLSAVYLINGPKVSFLE